MTKIVVLVALALLAWLALRRARARFLASPRGKELSAMWRLFRQLTASGDTAGDAGSRRSATGSGRPWGPVRDAAERTRLVRCGGCGTHVPETTARSTGDRWYCSEECARRAVAR
jgi:hypothetical protein